MATDTTISKRARLLSSLKPRDTRKDVERSRAYSHIVGTLRWTLPALMLVVLATLIAWPMVRAQKLNSIISESIPNLVVENLHLTSLDSNNQPYSLTASRALQAGDSKNVIELEQPQGEITLSSGAWLAGKAKQGSFDQKNKRLWLEGNVELFHDEGYEFKTNEALFDMKDNTAWGNKEVLIQGPFGEIHGTGFKVTDKGNVIIIKGHAMAKLNLRTALTSDKPKAP